MRSTEVRVVADRSSRWLVSTALFVGLAGAACSPGTAPEAGTSQATAAGETEAPPPAPGDAAALRDRAVELLDLGDHAGAIEQATEYVSLVPDHPDSHVVLGKAHLAAARAEEQARRMHLRDPARHALYGPASRALSRAVALDPDHAEARHRLAFACSQMDLTVQALDHADRSLAIAESDEALLVRGKTLHHMRRYNEAVPMFQRLHERNPEDADHLVALGSLQESLREYDRALVYYQQARQLDPSDTFCLNSMANVYLRKKDYEKALETLEQSHVVDPNQPRVHQSMEQLRQLIERRRSGQ